jgi:hypothetical protein
MNKARENLKHKYYNVDEWNYDFGFHYADQMDVVINAAKVLEIYGEWPDDGSYFDQDTNLVADMLRYTQLERHVERTEFSKDK